MTELLKKAIEKIEQLSNEDKNAIATIILEELEDELKWSESFANSQDMLANLVMWAMPTLLSRYRIANI